MAQRTLDSQTISEITQKESEITHQSEPVRGGPTAQAQKHANEAISNPNVVSDIVKGETKITQNEAPKAGGPGAKVMSEAAQAGNEVGVQYPPKPSPIITELCNEAGKAQADIHHRHYHQTRATRSAVRGQETHTGTLDSETISRITRAETELTGRAEPAGGGPTAQAQRHAGEPIGSANLHDITEGEKKVTGGERVRGGPTATAQSELAKSRS